MLRVLILIILLLFSYNKNVYSEEKIVFIDLNYIFINSKAGKDLNSRVDDLSIELNKKITLTSYNIFSISISDKYIATCGSTSFSIFNHNYTLLFESNGNGEYHGIFIDNNSLYVANRLKNRIEIYELLV